MLFAGQTYETSYTVYNLASPPASCALAVTKPDGTLATPAPSVGSPVQGGPSNRDWTWTVDYPLPTAGVYQFAWSTSSPATSQPPDIANVSEYVSILSVADARAFLGVAAATDDLLYELTDSATRLAETVVGSLLIRTFTDTVPGRHAWRLRMPHGPLPTADAITSITTLDASTTWATADLVAEPQTGRVWRADGLAFTGGPWTAIYRGGRQVISGLIRMGVQEILFDLYSTQRGLTTDSDLPDMAEVAQMEQSLAGPIGGPGYRIPPRALAYLNPARPLVSGFA